MTNPETPRASLLAAVNAYEARQAAGDSSAEAMREALSAAALPHLRVQETPALELAESARAIAARLRIDLESVDREDARIALGNSARDVIRLAELIEAPHPRPVVDREALRDQISDRLRDFGVSHDALTPDLARREIADAALALLPTEEGEGA